MRRLTLLLTMLVCALPALAEDPHPFSVHDMLAMDRVGDPQVSPDGGTIAFTLRTTDLEDNRGRTDLWLVDVDGENARRLTSDPAGDWNPRWCLNGTLFFLSTRSGSSQVWNIDPRGGEAVQISDFPLDVGNLEVVPQLHKLAFTMDVWPNMTVAETVAHDEALAAEPTTGMIYDELMFRHWDHWEDGKRSHVFIWSPMDADADPVDLTPSLNTDTPTHPWGGSEEYAFSADGKTLVFTAKIKDGSEAAWSTDYDLYAVDTTGNSRRRCLTDANEAWDTAPLFSPDGKTLAYLAMTRAGFEADRFRIVLRDWPEGDTRYLDLVYDNLELSPRSLLWSADGKVLYMNADYLGQNSIFRMEVKSGKTKMLVRDGNNGSLGLAGKTLIYTKNHLRSPNEIYSFGSKEKRLTRLNDEKLAACLMGEPEQFSFTGWNGETVYAYVVKPYDWTAAKAAAGQTWPLTFLVHGGPQGSFGNDFHYRWNPQAYVGAGFATVAVDFHGSTGYGQDFCDAISGHWGDRPLEDLEKGLAATLERYGWLDGDRVVAAGASYGGYMINWMHGQPFGEKFKAFVCHDGNLDERMAYYDTEELWFPEWEHGGRPWEKDSGFGKHIPADFVQNWHVPTLVVHGALDYRVVDTQGLSTFTALRRRGVEARLLYYPDENHWVLQPQNSIQWHDEVMGWLTEHIE
jgi:dipeptidyl aminopeptidase/acylaminoacyl peptidase